MKKIRNMKDVEQLKIDPDRLLHSASHEDIISGATTDIYFIRTQEILRHLKQENTKVVSEVFASRPGILCGIDEALALLRTIDSDLKISSLSEGERFSAKEVVLRIEGSYLDFSLYETAILGMLASASGWATAASEVKEAAGDKPVYCFGARHVHPSVAPVMERAALVGGADGCSCILGAKLKQTSPVGTVPHAVFLVVGDTVKVAKAYNEIMSKEAPRVILVDTFKDEAEETLRVASALKEDLYGIRLDTPSERGGVTPGLAREIRSRLDQAGFNYVKILASGGINIEKINKLKDAGVDAFGVGSYISRAPAIDMTMDIKELDGKPIAKRGRIPGVSKTDRLQER